MGMHPPKVETFDVVAHTSTDPKGVLRAACTTGLLDAGTGAHAVQRAMTAVDGIATHDHDLDAWLRSQGMPVTWR
jgi:predicted RNA-binding protein associated with RNAse of E/G family